MAEGGEAHFCAETRQHKFDCAYFAGGGLADFDSMQEDKPSQSMFDDMKDDSDTLSANAEVPESEEPSLLDKVSTPLPTLAYESIIKPGVDTYEDQRSEGAGPIGAGLGAAAAVTGSAADIGRKAVINGMSFVNPGAGFIRGVISGGLTQGADEVSKMVSNEGDPQDGVGAALAHIAGAALLTGAFGAAGKTVSSKLAKVAESKVGAHLQSFLSGIGAAAQHPEEERGAVDAVMKDLYEGKEAIPPGPHPLFVGVSQEGKPAVEGIGGSFGAYKAGQKAYDTIISNGTSSIASAVGGEVGSRVGGMPGAIAGSRLAESLTKPIQKIISKIVNPAANWAVPTTMKIMSSGNTSELIDALGYAKNMARGNRAITNGIDGIFGGVARSGTKALGAEAAREKLDDWVKSGEASQDIQQQIYQNNSPQTQGFAVGGEVKKHEPSETPLLERNKGVALHYPEHNVMLNAARGRVGAYLNGLRPQENQAKLAFDDEPDTRQQTAQYHRALDLANEPLGILHEIKNGTLEPEHMAHMNAMYPEVNNLLQKKITKRIVDAQMSGEKPPYHIRQALSLFMGAPLSGELTPQSIQAAQAVFAPKQSAQQQGQPPTKNKRGTSTLTKASQAFLTGSQAREQRQMKA